MSDPHNEGSFQATSRAGALGKAWPAHAVTAGNLSALVSIRVQARGSGHVVKERVLYLDETPPVAQRQSHQAKVEMTRHNHHKQEAHLCASRVLRTLPSACWRAGAGALYRWPGQPSLLLAPRLRTPHSPPKLSEPTCEVRKTHFQRTKNMHYPNKSGEAGAVAWRKDREEVGRV